MFSVAERKLVRGAPEAGKFVLQKVIPVVASTAPTSASTAYRSVFGHTPPKQSTFISQEVQQATERVPIPPSSSLRPGPGPSLSSGLFSRSSGLVPGLGPGQVRLFSSAAAPVPIAPKIEMYLQTLKGIDPNYKFLINTTSKKIVPTSAYNASDKNVVLMSIEDLLYNPDLANLAFKGYSKSRMEADLNIGKATLKKPTPEKQAENMKSIAELETSLKKTQSTNSATPKFNENIEKICGVVRQLSEEGAFPVIPKNKKGLKTAYTVLKARLMGSSPRLQRNISNLGILLKVSDAISTALRHVYTLNGLQHELDVDCLKKLEEESGFGAYIIGLTTKSSGGGLDRSNVGNYLRKCKNQFDNTANPKPNSKYELEHPIPIELATAILVGLRYRLGNKFNDEDIKGAMPDILDKFCQIFSDKDLLEWILKTNNTKLKSIFGSLTSGLSITNAVHTHITDSKTRTDLITYLRTSYQKINDLFKKNIGSETNEAQYRIQILKGKVTIFTLEFRRMKKDDLKALLNTSKNKFKTAFARFLYFFEKEAT
jgi:hypothetical protein